MRVVLVVLLLLSGCAADPSCRLEKLTELPVRMFGNVPVLTAEINGRPATLVLDTGSDATLLTRAAARRVGAADSGRTSTMGGAAGSEVVGLTRIEGLTLGSVALKGVPAVLADAPEPPIDGLLGIDVLVGYEVELDVPHGRMALYRARQCATAGPGWTGPVVQLPTQQQAGSGHLFVPVRLDGEPLRAMLDSGASLSTVSLQSSEDVGINPRRLAAMPATRGQSVNAAGTLVRTIEFKELRVGADVMRAPRLAVIDLPPYAGDMLLGSDYLATRRVWFSFLLGRVFVQSAAAAVAGDTLVRDP